MMRGFAEDPGHAGWERWLAGPCSGCFWRTVGVDHHRGDQDLSGHQYEYFLWGGVPKIGRVRLGEVGEWVETLHEIAAYVLFFALILHVGGALKHVVLDRDGTLMRILKPSSPGK